MKEHLAEGTRGRICPYRQVVARMLACVALMFGVLVSACAPGGSGSDAAATPSVGRLFTTTTDTADVMDADAPAGWVETTDRGETGLDYIASEDGTTGFAGASIRATRLSPDVLLASGYEFAGRANTYDFDAIFTSWLYDAERYNPQSDVAELPARTIDGDPARGFSYTTTTNQAKARYQMWLVARSDGLWRITLNAAPDQMVLPPELDGILDTITWTTPSDESTRPST
ncbi:MULTISPECIES: hypothetical protein [unclassified Actinobaculum]|uniref:hypothetical protein n=1 Tax=unclassified Actinobaculum TaxID=2609299 RepID=UPI000D528218|nr:MULTISPECIES: hypothetical protein [unclassified Actinobaculum]AWE42639.1 hypothetical protein DDD63_07640 [Actinobaculum sp. 313]RTE47978.1 hypothetical protein EKN07_11520 [Actinobaculum sp. 352]